MAVADAPSKNTTKKAPKMTTIPYIQEQTKETYPLLITRPKDRFGSVTESGFILPDNLHHEFEESVVLIAGKASDFKPGDTITYRAIDREKGSRETVFIDGKEYDIVAEHNVWSINDLPYNRIYIEPVTTPHVTDSGFILPPKAEGYPQKGIVVMSPTKWHWQPGCQPGDVVEYRKNTKKIYHTALIDGKELEILFLDDIYTINGQVTPNRIIVKVDLRKQQEKKQQTDSGFYKSPLFGAMRYNLQYGVVMSVGSEARKTYPGLVAGNTVILHHTIESQPHRILSWDIGKYGVAVSVYLMIDNFDINAREIFGKFGPKNSIIPFGKSVFLEWDFVVADREVVLSDFVDISGSILDATNLEDLKVSVDRKRKEAVDRYKGKFNSIIADREMYRYDPAAAAKLEELDRAVGELKFSAERTAKYYQQDYALICKGLDGELVLAPYKHLYPIRVKDKSYLIANKDFILATSKKQHSDMQVKDWLPIADKVLVQPLPEEETGFVVPESIKESPQRGRVVSVGRDINPEEIKPDYVVYHRKMVGVEVKLEGTAYLVLRRNDIFLVRQPEAAI